MTVRRFLPIAVLLIVASVSFAQDKGESSKTDLLGDLARSDKLLSECMSKKERESIEKFGRKPIPVSLHCPAGCPVRLPKPYYPAEARRLKMRAEVVVDTIVDESGKVVHASVRKGPKIFAQAALAAAHASEFQRILACDTRIRFRRVIKYYFHPGA